MSLITMMTYEEKHQIETSLYNLYLCKMIFDFFFDQKKALKFPSYNYHFDGYQNYGVSPFELVSNILDEILAIKMEYITTDDKGYQNLIHLFPDIETQWRAVIKMDFPQRFQFKEAYYTVDDDEPSEMYFWGEATVKVLNSTIIFNYSENYSGEANYVSLLNFLFERLEENEMGV